MLIAASSTLMSRSSVVRCFSSWTLFNISTLGDALPLSSKAFSSSISSHGPFISHRLISSQRSPHRRQRQRLNMSSGGGSGDDDSKVVALNVKVAVKPGHRDEFLKLIRADAERSRTVEPGCLQFMVGKDINEDDNNNTFYLHEQYENQAALDFHNGTPHLQDVVKFMTDKDPLVEPIVINTYTCQHHPQNIDNSQFGSYCLNVESSVRPELRDEFMDLMTSHQLNSQSEPGCLQFDWGVSYDDPNTFYIHEEYKNKDGFDAHERSSHFAKFIKFNNEKKPYTKPQVVQFFTNLKY